MADALISPAVGGTMWAVSGGLIAYCSRKIREAADGSRIPLMGVLGAFIFAAQMINFTIPGTGSSGHIGGGMILAILLGRYASFLVMASVLVVQALFFADGGLLALGCNIFNLGFFTSFVAYPFIYKKIAGDKPSRGRILAGSMIAAIAGLQLGSLGVVLETASSGISELPVKAFLLLMQPIHLAIGIVEGVVTAAVVTFVWKARPEILAAAEDTRPAGVEGIKSVAVILVLAALITGGFVSWFASSDPDGLEWAVSRVSGKEELEGREGVYRHAAGIQEGTALFPGYGLRKEAVEPADGQRSGPGWPVVDAGTSMAGLAGGALTLLTVLIIGIGLRRRKYTP